MTRTYRTSDDIGAIRERVRSESDQTRGGVFRRSDLVVWGVPPAVVPVMLRRRLWVRLHHGVYADRDVVEGAETPLQAHLLTATASVAAIDGTAHLFGPAAAALHGIPFDRTILGPVHVVRPVGRDSRVLRRRITAADRLDPAIVHQHDLTPDHVTSVRGVPVVSRELAAVSTSALSDPEWALVPLDAVAWQSPGTIEALGVLAEDWNRLRGIGIVRRALSDVRTGAQTPLETLSRVRLIRLGLPEPTLQAPLYDQDGLIGYADMLWEGLGVVGEADGALKYTSGRVLLEEKLREDRIRARGLTVVRWTWDEILRRPERVRDRVRDAAALQRRSGR